MKRKGVKSIYGSGTRVEIVFPATSQKKKRPTRPKPVKPAEPVESKITEQVPLVVDPVHSLDPVEPVEPNPIEQVLPKEPTKQVDPKDPTETKPIEQMSDELDFSKVIEPNEEELDPPIDEEQNESGLILEPEYYVGVSDCPPTLQISIGNNNKLSEKKMESQLPKSQNDSTAQKQLQEDYVQVKNENLKYYLGCWLRFYNIATQKHYSGGKLRNITGKFVEINVPFTKTPLVIKSNDYLFYSKSNLPQNEAIRQLESEFTRLRKMKKSNTKSK